MTSKIKKIGGTHSIIREDKEWGSRLIVKPFIEPRLAAVEISIDIDKPKGERRPDVKIWFTAVPLQNPFKPGDLIIWTEALRALQAEAQAIADKMKPAATPAKKKKKRAKP